MKKSQEFWIDMGYLDILNSNTTASKKIKADVVEAAKGFAISVGIAVGIAVLTYLTDGAAAASEAFEGAITSSSTWANIAVDAAIVSIEA